MRRAEPPASERLFRVLFRIFPRRFREEYGADAVELFRDRLTEVRSRRGSLTRLWLRTLHDLLLHGILERIRELRSDARDVGRGAILQGAARSLRRSPGLAAVIVLTLALGIGANVALYSVLRGVLLRPLPYSEAERLVRLWSTRKDGDPELHGPSPLDFVDWAVAPGLQSTAAWHLRSATYRFASRAEELRSAEVTVGFFRVLGVEPLLGRSFRSGETVENGPVILSHRAWQRLFGGDPLVVGRSLRSGEASHEIVGVMPQGFTFPDQSVDLWVAWDLSAAYGDRPETRSWRFIDGIGRLSPGTTLAQAEESLDRVAARLEETYPITNRGWDTAVLSLHEATVGGVRATLWIAFGSVFFILLIACVNVANLLLSRVPSRAREGAIRSTLGASRGRLAAELAAEYGLLGLIAGFVGLLIGQALLKIIVALDAGQIPRLAEVSIDGGVFVFTAAVAAGTCVGFGLVPALQLFRRAGSSPVGDGRRTTASRAHRRAQETFVATQVAVALVLLAGASLFSASLRGILAVPPGIDLTHVATFRVSPDLVAGTSDEVVDYYEGLIQHLGGVPGVLGVGAAQTLPLNPVGNDFQRPYRPTGSGVQSAEAPRVQMRIVTPGYADAIGMKLVEGSPLPSATRGDPPVALVNETLARRLWPDGGAVGGTFEIDYLEGWRQYRVVGVAGDVRHYGLRTEPVPEVFLAHSQVPYLAMSIVARTVARPDDSFEALDRAVRSWPPSQPAHDFVSGDALVAGSTAEERFLSVLLSLLAGIGLILATTGVYGVIAYSVTHRRREIGVRMAVGATPSQVVTGVLRQAVVVAFMGFAVGMIMLLLLSGVLEASLYGVDPWSATTGVPVGLILLVASGIAAYLPARKAAWIPPSEALREQ